MQRLTVTLTNPKANDQLLVSGALPGGIAVDPSSTAANLVLTGTASIAAYQSAVQQVRFTNSGGTPDTTSRQVAVTVGDGQASSNTAVSTITVEAGANAAPVLDLDGSASGTGYSTVFVAGNGDVSIADVDVSISDPDDSEMQRLTVTLTNPKANDQLLVSGALPGGIAVDPSSTAANLVLTGTASIAAYQSAVQQVRFTNSGGTPDTTSRQVAVTVSDGQASSNTAVSTITVEAGANAAPVLDLDGSASGSGFTTIFSAGGSGVRIADSDMSITDSDSATVERATITLASPKSGDRLALTGSLPSGIAIDPSSAATSVILSGAASHAAYKTALQQIQFDNDNPNPDLTTRQVKSPLTMARPFQSWRLRRLPWTPANAQPWSDGS